MLPLVFRDVAGTPLRDYVTLPPGAAVGTGRVLLPLGARCTELVDG